MRCAKVSISIITRHKLRCTLIETLGDDDYDYDAANDDKTTTKTTNTEGKRSKQ